MVIGAEKVIEGREFVDIGAPVRVMAVAPGEGMIWIEKEPLPRMELMLVRLWIPKY